MRTSQVLPRFVQRSFDFYDSSLSTFNNSRTEVNSIFTTPPVINEAALPAFVFSTLSIVSRITDNFSMFGRTIGDKLSLGIDSISASFIAILGLLCFNESQHAKKSNFI